MKHLMLAALLLALPAAGMAQTEPSPAQTAPQTPAPPDMSTQDNCRPSATSLDSPAGQEWLHDNGWRYADPARAAADYKALVTGQSPWPGWFTPEPQTLPVGTRFQMAMAPSQHDDQPGAFGTFDRIDSVAQVHDDLAVLVAWKPAINRVVTFEVTQPLPVNVGPIGPQIDPLMCRLLPGRWSQFQMLVPGPARMQYIRVLEERLIQ